MQEEEDFFEFVLLDQTQALSDLSWGEGLIESVIDHLHSP